jgi:hypothetical protein
MVKILKSRFIKLQIAMGRFFHKSLFLNGESRLDNGNPWQIKGMVKERTKT